MILKTLRLRGAIGIRNGLGKEDVTVDFTKFAPGLIAVIGPNGAGKTTAIENLTPFLLMKSRPGALSRQFFLKDSCRDLLIGMNGDEYRFLVNINAVSGKMERVVYKNGEGLNPDGKEETYNEIVTKLYGPAKVFFASLFMAQRRESFADIDPKDGKILLLKMIGAEHLQAKCDYATAASKGLRDEIEKVRAAIDYRRQTLDSFETIDTDITATEQGIADCQELISASEDIAADIGGQIAAMQEKVTAQAVTKSQVAQLKEQFDALTASGTEWSAEVEGKIRRLRDAITSDQKLLAELELTYTPERLAKIKARISEAETVKCEYLAINEQAVKYNRLTADLAQARTEYANAKGEHEQEFAKRKEVLSGAKNALETLESTQRREAEALSGDIERKSRAITILATVPCQQIEAVAESCRQCQFLKDAVAAQEVIDRLSTDLTATKERHAAARADAEAAVDAATDSLAALGDWAHTEQEKRLRGIGEFVKSEVDGVGFNEVAAASLKQRYDAFEKDNPSVALQTHEAGLQKIESRRDTLAGMQSQLTEVEETRDTKVQELTDQLAGLTDRMTALEAMIDLTADELLSRAKVDIDLVQQRLKTTAEQLARHQAVLEGQQRDKARTLVVAEEMAADEKTLACLQSDQADWDHLALNLSRNGGFQSILVDSIGQEMSPYADRMLATYGRNWTMEFSTSKPTDDGKQKEGFFITINTPDGPRELGELSGGEEVIANQVIQDTISEVLRRRSGLVLQTAIKDESDGALDGERAIAYLKSVEAAHVASGLHHTILISHRPELQQMIPQRLRFVPGEGIIIEIE